MKKVFASFLTTLIFAVGASGQSSEIGVFGGVSYYMGDINKKKQFYRPKFAFGGVYRYNINEHWAAKGNVYYGKVEAYDADVPDAEQIERNLSFHSTILEVAAEFEFNFFRFTPGSMERPFSPYIFGGFSIFKYNPKADIDGGTYEINGITYDIAGGTYALQPLGTEGQGTTAYPDRKKYSLTNFGIPFGIGVKINAAPAIGIALEWGMRPTFTDYLDDVSDTYADPLVLAAEYGPVSAALSDRSLPDPDEPVVSNVGRQRGNANNNDWYSFAGVILTYRFQDKQPKCAAYD